MSSITQHQSPKTESSSGDIAATSPPAAPPPLLGTSAVPKSSIAVAAVDGTKKTGGSKGRGAQQPGAKTGGGGGGGGGGGKSKSKAAGTKRTIDSLPPLNREGRNLSEKKLRRLEKNRLSARECRRKKKEAAQNLEREINVLEAENLRLRLQLQVGEEAEESSWKEQEKLTEGLDTLLKSGAQESEIYASIEEFKEKFADYGRDRRSAIEFHLRNVERLLLPTTTTSVAMRALHGGPMHANLPASPSRLAPSRSDPGTSSVAADEDKKSPAEGGAQKSENRENSPVPAEVDTLSSSAASAPTDGPAAAEALSAPSGTPQIITPVASAESSAASDSPSSSQNQPAPAQPPLEPKSMFHYLVQYLQVTPEQAMALKDSRFIAKELDSVLTESLSVLEELRMRLTQVGEDLEAEMNSVRAVLTPTQAAKFLVWVANNGACMHMLNELWSKSYPEPTSGGEDEETGEAKSTSGPSVPEKGTTQNKKS